MATNAKGTVICLLLLVGALACRKTDPQGQRSAGTTPPPPGTPAAPTGPAAPGEDDLVPGELPTQVTGVNLLDIDVDNARTRCDYVERGNAKYGTVCYAVAMQPDGSELRATGIVEGTVLTWATPKVVDGTVEQIACTVAEDLLSQRCEAKLVGVVAKATLRFEIAVANKATARERKAGFVLALPYSVGVAAGIVPQIPLTYQSSPTRQGFQPYVVSPDVAAFDTLQSVCRQGDSLYFASFGVVFRLTGGAISFYAGLASRLDADGSHRFRLALSEELYLACAKDGIVVSDSDANRIYRVRETGAVEVLAGPDGWEDPVYKSIESVTKVAPDGFTADGELARGALLDYPTAVAVAPDGSIVFEEGGRIRRIGTDGRLTTVFEFGSGSGSGEFLDSIGEIEVLADGSVIFTNPGAARVSTVDANGVATTVPIDIPLNRPRGLATHADGRIFLGDGNRVYEVAGGKARLLASDFEVSRIGLDTIEAGLNGEVYVVDGDGGRLWRIDSSGSKTLLVGGAERGLLCKKAQMAKDARIVAGTAMAARPDGSTLLVDVDTENDLPILKVLDSTGTSLEILAGCEDAEGAAGAAPDPATELTFDLAVSIAGIAYYPSLSDSSLYHLVPGGKPKVFFNFDDIEALALDDDEADDPNHNPFSDTSSIYAVAVDRSDKVLLAYESGIYRIEGPAQAVLVAGKASPGGVAAPDGAVALGASIAPTRLAVAADGTIVFSERTRNLIRMIDTDGKLRTVAGTGVQGSTGDGGDALAAQISNPEDVEFAPDGTIYFVEADESDRTGRVRTLVRKDGMTMIDTLYGRTTQASECGTGRIAGTAANGEVDLAIRNSVSVLCQGRPTSVAIHDGCPQTPTRILVAQRFGLGFSNIIEIMRPCSP